jgi:hypothetical protein
MAFEHHHAQAAPGQMISMRQAENTGAGDGDIVLGLHHVFPPGFMCAFSSPCYF